MSKTISIEDCLKEENNRFRLVLAASKRARQISNGHEPLVEKDGSKSTILALREIAERKTAIAQLLHTEG